MHVTYANSIYNDTHIVLDFDWFEKGLIWGDLILFFGKYIR